MKACIVSLSLLFGTVFGAVGDNCWPKVIFPGDYPDPSIMRDGRDFYLTWSGGDSRPGLTVYHSQDLIHWTALSCAAQTFANPIWAPEIVKIDGKYAIYFPAKGDFNPPRKWNVYRVTAPEMKGPWSMPELVVANAGIDPGIARDDDGTVWLWLHHGKRVKLDGAGAKAIGAVEGGRYKGWRFPEEWRPGTKNLTLESPKLFKRGGWWYMVSAEGGTGMPLTAHMAIVARSKSPAGPWENSPYNPLVRAKSASEEWWCTGHATLFDDVQGNWWAVYHGYRNSFMTLGRSILLAPIAWSKDGWPILDKSGRKPLPPTGSVVVGGDYDDDFEGDSLSLNWQTFGNDVSGKTRIAEGSLRLVAVEGASTSGEGSFPGTVLLFKPSAERYAASVDVKTDEGVRSGLVLFYDRGNYVGVTTDGRDFILRFPDGTGRREPNPFGQHVVFNLENNANRLSLYVEDGSGRRTRLMNGIDVSQMHHGKGKCKNFRALHIGLVAEGRGEASFGSFRYRVTALP